VGRFDRAAVIARVVFLALVVRLAEVFFDDFVAGDFLEADFFLVTFFPISFRLDGGLPDRLAPLLLDFFFDTRATARLVELRVAVLFEVVFLEAAFFFGIRLGLQVAPNQAGDYT
jgi:hypothetical protein